MNPTAHKIKPDKVCLELTNHCNLDCVFCDRLNLKHTMELGDMSLKLLGKILEDIKANYSSGEKLDTLSLVGLGEPTLNKHFNDHIALISKYRAYINRTQLASNAVSLDEKRALGILESVDQITLSINSSNAEDYKEMMGRDKFEQAIENTRNFLRLKRSVGSNIEVGIQIMETKEDSTRSLDEMQALIPEAQEDLDVTIHVQNVFNKPVVQEDDHGLKVLQSEQRRHPCLSMYTITYIDIEGFMYPCTIGNDSYRKTSSLAIGNVFEKDLVEIYNDEAITRARENASRSELPFKECENCNIWNLMPNLYRFEESSQTWEPDASRFRIYNLKKRLRSIRRYLPRRMLIASKTIYTFLVNANNKKLR